MTLHWSIRSSGFHNTRGIPAWMVMDRCIQCLDAPFFCELEHSVGFLVLSV